MLCESKQVLTTPCKVSWKQCCETHLVSCPDSCSLKHSSCHKYWWKYSLQPEWHWAAASATHARGRVTQVSIFHSPLPSLQVRTPLQLEEPRKGRRQIPKHRWLLPFYTPYLYVSPPLMCLSISLGFNPSVPKSSHMSSVTHFDSISDNGLLVHHIRCSSLFSLPVCDQTFTLHSLSAKGHYPNDRGPGWNKAWHLVTQLAFLSFQLTSVFLSAYLNVCGYSQAYFRKTVALSMGLRAINLLDAEKTRFEINLLKHIFAPTC